MSPHCIEVTTVEKNGASPAEKLKISAFIHLPKKLSLIQDSPLRVMV